MKIGGHEEGDIWITRKRGASLWARRGGYPHEHQERGIAMNIKKGTFILTSRRGLLVDHEDQKGDLRGHPHEHQERDIPMNIKKGTSSWISRRGHPHEHQKEGIPMNIKKGTPPSTSRMGHPHEHWWPFFIDHNRGGILLVQAYKNEDGVLKLAWTQSCHLW